MEQKLLADVEELLQARKDDAGLVAALSQSLGEASHEQPSVRVIRDKFTSTLRAVRSGRVQLVGTNPEDQVVMISLKDLARMVRWVARDVSFGEALRMQPSFRPVSLRAEMRQRPRGRQAYGVTRRHEARDGCPETSAEG
ncbi:hypothetical protein [Siccirubricoccus phaeus]|uniref:hypothetical protein n=1 Tax=Siccirubricoccus phaeus TaxID=2595053 RepID=UPI00165C9085|nr:hypothetical protein [Siccirubricoccus phaeus]